MLSQQRARCICCSTVLLIACRSSAAADLHLPHVRVTYEGIDEPNARALARTVESARAICADKYRFEMPEVIRLNVSTGPGQSVRLFNDGVDTFSLSLRSEADLRKPATSGIFHLYGLCHEVGHLAMYRPIKDRAWLSTPGAEGWAHYLGSALVDEVYANEGPDLWPDAYDYRADGTRRLDEQLGKADPPEVAHCARLWRELAQAIGPEKMPLLFAAWGRAKIDPADPVAGLKEEVARAAADAPLAAWWDAAGQLIFVRREGSRFPKQQIAGDRLAGSPRTLAHDDGESKGKASIAGSGHAVRFSVPDSSWYLTAVEVHGSRYGTPAAPKEDLHVWLCDEQFRAVADFLVPYEKFERGEPKWVRLPLDPTSLPTEFIICVGFNPAASKGVYVHYAAGNGTNSLTGLPGTEPRAYPRGSWMIRASVDQLKEADSLTPALQAEESAQYVDPRRSDGSSAAVIVPDVPLLHTAQFMSVDARGQIEGKGRLDLQLESILNSLDISLIAERAAFARVVKINVVAADAAVAQKVRDALATKFFQSREAKPAVSYVTGKLRHPDALVAMDAVVMSPPTGRNSVNRTRIPDREERPRMAHAATMPAGPKVYVSGQAEKGKDLAEMTRNTMASLAATLKHLGLGLKDVVQIKSFVGPIADADDAEREIVAFFKDEPLVPPLVFVEWTTSPSIEIELIATAAAAGVKPDAAVEFITPPGMATSPVFSRVARMGAGPTIYFSGLYGDSNGNATDETLEIFEKLGGLLDKTQTDIRHLVKATYYVSTAEAATALRERRLKVYDPERPPAASLAPVAGTGVEGKTITIDLIAAPRRRP
jgi:enamine deaminase RidA (YjgF/YER057c/UK114 family)